MKRNSIRNGFMTPHRALRLPGGAAVAETVGTCGVTSDLAALDGSHRGVRVPHPRDELSLRASPDDELLLAFRQGKLLGLRLRRNGADDSIRILVPYRKEAVASAFENGVEVGFCREAPKSAGIVFLRRGGNRMRTTGGTE